MNSTIDAVILVLYRLVKGRMAVTQPEVQVIDGPTVEDVGQDIIAIGIAAEESNTQATLFQAGLYTQRETYDLDCLVRSWTGDDDLSARRTRAFELFEEVAEIVNGDPTLDQAVARAKISAVSYNPVRLPEGAVASVTFRVRIEAFTS